MKTTKRTKIDTKDLIDRTKDIPKSIVWRDAIRMLNTGEYFIAPRLKATSIMNQIKVIKAQYLELGIDPEFKSQVINETEFIVIRIK